MNKKEVKIKQALFIIFRVHIKDNKVASAFINFIFFLPILIIWFKLIIRLIPDKVFKDVPFSKKELSQMIGAKGILLDVKTKDGDRIYIKNI